MTGRRGRRLSLTLGLGTIAVLGVAASIWHEDVHHHAWNLTRGVPVVRTWENLRSEPAIELAGGATVRVGIDAWSAPAGSGVLLYALVEGEGPARVGGAQPLGPLEAQVLYPGGVSRQRAEVVERLADSSGGPSLFLRTVPLAERGWHEVRLLANGELVRKVYVRATGARRHPWLTWGDPERGDRRLQRLGAPLTVSVSNRSHGPGLPAWEGWTPIPAGEDRTGALPPLFPAAPDPGFRLAASGSGEELVLTVTSDVGMDPTLIADRFLTRWWVNGEPYVPAPGCEFCGMARFANGPPLPVRTVRFRVELDPSKIKAQSGDRIGLQLLYCSDGCEVVGGGLAHLQAFQASFDPLHAGVRLSNRVDFTAP